MAQPDDTWRDNMSDEIEYPDDEWDDPEWDEWWDDTFPCGCCRCCGCTCDQCPECGSYFCYCDEDEEE